MATTPKPIIVAPPLPQRDDPSTFEDRSDAYYKWQSEALPGGIDEQAGITYANAVEAEQSANQAAASQSGANSARTDAIAARDKSRDWAESSSAPEPGGKSAKTYAEEAGSARDSAWDAADTVLNSAGIPNPPESGKFLSSKEGGGVEWKDSTIIASTMQAQDAEDNTTMMTPLRTKESIWHNTYETGDVRQTARPLGGEAWLPLTVRGQHYYYSYPKLGELLPTFYGEALATTSISCDYAAASENGHHLVAYDSTSKKMTVLKRGVGEVIEEVVSTVFEAWALNRVNSLAISNDGKKVYVGSGSPLYILTVTGSTITETTSVAGVGGAYIRMIDTLGIYVTRRPPNGLQVLSVAGDVFTQIYSEGAYGNVFDCVVKGGKVYILCQRSAEVSLLCYEAGAVTLVGQVTVAGSTLVAMSLSRKGNQIVTAGSTVSEPLQVYNYNDSGITPAYTIPRSIPVARLLFVGDGDLLVSIRTGSEGGIATIIGGHLVSEDGCEDVSLFGPSASASFWVRPTTLATMNYEQNGYDLVNLLDGRGAVRLKERYKMFELQRDAPTVGTNYINTGADPRAALDLQFAGASMLDPRIQFTRASLDWDERGREYGINEPIVTEEGLWVSGQRTDLIPYSSDFTMWAKARVSAVSENGFWVVTDATENQESGTHALVTQFGSSGVSGEVTISVRCKMPSSGKIEIRSESPADWSSRPFFLYDFNNMSVLNQQAAPGTKASIENLGGGEYLLTATGVFSGGSSMSFGIFLLNSSGSRTYAPDPDDPSAIILISAQVETGGNATREIPTNGSQVTVLGSSASFLKALPKEGAILVEAIAPLSEPAHRSVFTWRGAGSTEQIRLYFDASTNELRFRYRAAEGDVWHPSLGLFSSGDSIKAGIKWTGDKVSVSVNGNIISRATAITPVCDSFFIGSFSTTSDHLNSSIKLLQLYDGALTDDALQELTVS